MSVSIIEARWPEDRDTVRALFRAYVDGLGIDLGFQGIDAEFASLPGKYARPAGLVLLARDEAGAAMGTVAYRPFAPGDCEMKRLYVAPEQRGRGAGRSLCDRLLDEARTAGYRRMLLDTGDWLTPALTLYRALGFAPIPAYYHNPIAGTVYMSREL
ncbi:MAG TPA: GNAT family N-acetyltransferase [Stellaceae bacterium]|jgi:GNAT superfamily N-acetyltransferase|nr:GNAT family N-acetyltransferase [Stellaceae bacterium]